MSERQIAARRCITAWRQAQSYQFAVLQRMSATEMPLKLTLTEAPLKTGLCVVHVLRDLDHDLNTAAPRRHSLSPRLSTTVACSQTLHVAATIWPEFRFSFWAVRWPIGSSCVLRSSFDVQQHYWKFIRFRTRSPQELQHRETTVRVVGWKQTRRHSTH